MECYKAKCFFERQNNGKNEALSQEKSKFDKLEKCHARPFLEAIVFFFKKTFRGKNNCCHTWKVELERCLFLVSYKENKHRFGQYVYCLREWINPANNF